MYISHKYKVPLALYIKIHRENSFIFMCNVNFFVLYMDIVRKEQKKNVGNIKNIQKNTEMHIYLYLSCLNNNVHKKGK